MNKLIDFVLTEIREVLGHMNHRKRLDKSGSFKLLLIEEHHVFVERLYFLYSLFLIMLLEVWLFHTLFSWLFSNFHEIYLISCLLWLAVELLIVYRMEDSFHNKIYLPSGISSWRLNVIPLFLCVVNSCSNVVYLFVFSVGIRNSFISMIYLKIVIFCLSVLYICFLGLQLKKIVSVDYNPAKNTKNLCSIGFGDIILVKRGNTVYVVDEKVETLDFGYKNEILLLQDYSCDKVPLSSIRAIILTNGLDFNKVLVPDVANRTFIVKNLVGCSGWEDRSYRTDTEVLRVLDANFI